MTISILRSYSSAIALIDSSVSVWVRVAISPIVISFLITSALPSPSSSATSRTVAPDWTLVASGSLGSSALGGGSSSIGRRRRPPRRRGGRCGGGPPIWSRRDAWESITTRRFFVPPPPPAAFGRAGFAAGFGFAPFCSAAFSLAGALAGAACFGAASCLGFSAFAAGFLAGFASFSGAAPSPPAEDRALSASASSTLEAAAFASMPAAFSAASTSLLVSPWALAISWTRFLANLLLGLLAHRLGGVLGSLGLGAV